MKHLMSAALVTLFVSVPSFGKTFACTATLTSPIFTMKFSATQEVNPQSTLTLHLNDSEFKLAQTTDAAGAAIYTAELLDASGSKTVARYGAETTLVALATTDTGGTTIDFDCPATRD